MTAFTTNADIANRALQRLGVARITSFADASKPAKEVSFCYDKLRRAELRRNVWRFATRRVMLRAIGTALQNWNTALTYSSGAYVAYNGVNYTSLINSNTGNEPDTSPTDWKVFLGNTTLLVTFSAWASGTTYAQGMVSKGSDGRLYQSMTSSNAGNDPTTDTVGNWSLYFGTVTASQYDSTQTYNVGELVFYTTSNTLYSSTINENANDPTTSNSGWVQQTATSAPIVVQWPAGTGPQIESTTKNAYYLPSGYLRVASQDPSAGRTSFLGFPSSNVSLDWVFEGNLLLSMDAGPIMFRFCADVVDVTQMDDLFCEGLAARLALELAETLTQSQAKFGVVTSEYKQFMSDARNVNGIETGPTMPPLDDYIVTRF